MTEPRAWGVEGLRRKLRANLFALGGVQIGDCFDKQEVETMSVAFTREESAETASEVELPDRPISPHPNLVTASGLEALATAMAEWRAAYNAAQQIEGRRTSPRCRGRVSRNEIFRRSSRDCSGPSATHRVRRSGFWTSGDVQPQGREAPGLPNRRGGRSGSSEWINFLRLPRRAGSNRQSPRRCCLGGRPRDRDSLHRVGGKCPGAKLLSS